MGSNHFIEYLVKLVLYAVEICGLTVLFVWVVARSIREIRDIINTESRSTEPRKSLVLPAREGRHEG
jgi:hypothetical protein